MGELGKGELMHLSPVLDGPWFTLPFADILLIQQKCTLIFVYTYTYIYIHTKQIIYRVNSICLCDDKKNKQETLMKTNVLSDIMWLCAGVLVT